MNKVKSGVYEIKNIKNGKVYIGSSVDIHKRIKSHKNSLNKNSHYNEHLQRAWNKYGEENFDFNILEIVKEKDKLIEREQYWIDTKKSADRNFGYNLSPTAWSNQGIKYNIEHREKMSSFTTEEIRDIKLLHRDTDLSYEAIANIFNCVRGAISNIVSGTNCDWVKINDDDKLDYNKYGIYINNYKRVTHKLSEQDVKDIKMLLRENIKQSVIAKIFNVDRANISAIKRGEIYKNILITDNDVLDKLKYGIFLNDNNVYNPKLTEKDVKNN